MAHLSIGKCLMVALALTLLACGVDPNCLIKYGDKVKIKATGELVTVVDNTPCSSSVMLIKHDKAYSEFLHWEELERINHVRAD